MNRLANDDLCKDSACAVNLLRKHNGSGGMMATEERVDSGNS